MKNTAEQSRQIRQYMLITGNYWSFTLTDGALRMLVVLYFYQLGYTPLAIAFLFLLYEAFGVVTNLIGSWLGARFGLNKIMNIGLLLQIIALALLLVPTSFLSIPWVMAAQALSGIAKDLNKMSAKSFIKLLVPSNQNSQLFKWVAFLTGSKNALKGCGFFLGGLLLSGFGFRGAILIMALALLIVWIISLLKLKGSLGQSKNKPKFKAIFAKSSSINYLSAARMFLFGARDVWFVVALPVFLSSQLQWSHTFVGGFFAVWVILYGIVQSLTPKLIGKKNQSKANGRTAFATALPLATTPFLIALGMYYNWPLAITVVGGLLIFGAIFAINSALHSYLIVQYASREDVALDVGFYYMANAMGRLIGTVLSGLAFQLYGLEICLLISGSFILVAAILSLRIDQAADRNIEKISTH